MPSSLNNTVIDKKPPWPARQEQAARLAEESAGGNTEPDVLDAVARLGAAGKGEVRKDTVDMVLLLPEREWIDITSEGGDGGEEKKGEDGALDEFARPVDTRRRRIRDELA